LAVFIFGDKLLEPIHKLGAKNATFYQSVHAQGNEMAEEINLAIDCRCPRERV
jgi:hypothetical protein